MTDRDEKLAQAHLALMQNWPFTKPVRASRIVADVFDEPESPESTAVADAIRVLLQDEDRPTVVQVGGVLYTLRDKVRGGLKIVRGRDDAGVYAWSVERVEAKPNEAQRRKRTSRGPSRKTRLVHYRCAALAALVDTCKQEELFAWVETYARKMLDAEKLLPESAAARLDRMEKIAVAYRALRECEQERVRSVSGGHSWRPDLIAREDEAKKVLRDLGEIL